ncbi:MAG: hypothetical protein CMO26_14080 [Thiotrichales bacterium]|nr:hypothetical protein [Thiotrichales bacterium]|tara:strand:- start:170 stop:859 length:690 start_codon:yes stop_codon:yes gene_type:complete
MTAVMTGLREGELLGLQWGDIDWNSPTIPVRRQYTNGRCAVPKSKLSCRTGNLPSGLLDALRVWRLKCPKGDHDLVFPNGKGNPESHSNLLQRGFYPALRRAKLRKIRFHDLRHTFCSLLIKNREDPKRIQRLMGYSSIRITFDIYGHLFPDEGGDVASRLEDLILGGSRRKNATDHCTNSITASGWTAEGFNGGQGRNRTTDTRIFSPQEQRSEHDRGRLNKTLQHFS